EGVLRAQDQVQQKPAREREDDQALRVRLPILLPPGIDPEHAVQRALWPREQRRQEYPLAAVHLRHVAAERERERGQNGREQDDREPARERHALPRPPVMRSARLELLPTDKRVEQIGDYEHRDNEAEEVGAAHVRDERPEHGSPAHTRSIPSIATSSRANTSSAKAIATKSMTQALRSARSANRASRAA